MVGGGGRRGEFAGRGRRGASVVRHEKMVIPSRMCPMHMHVFPQNGWPRCGLDEGAEAAAGRERSELTGRDEEGDGDDRTGEEVQEDMVDVEVDQEEAEEEEEVEVTLRLATGKKSMSSPPALALSLLSRSTQPSATSIGQNKRTRIHDP